jgi:Tol biopolymer transport system component
LFDSSFNNTVSIFKQGINESTAQPLVADPHSPIWPRLSADGNSILYVEVLGAPAPPYQLMRTPVNGGVPQAVGEPTNGLNYECARAPSNLCVLLQESTDDKHLVVAAFDPLKGPSEVLRTIEKDPSAHLFGASLSPDGSTFAISRSGEAEIHIRLLSLVGGSDREITVKGWSNLPLGGLDWSVDGKGFYVGSVSPQAATLLYVDLKGNARVLWQFKGTRSTHAIPSPDGRYLAIMGGVSNSNVWMLEGF